MVRFLPVWLYPQWWYANLLTVEKAFREVRHSIPETPSLVLSPEPTAVGSGCGDPEGTPPGSEYGPFSCKASLKSPLSRLDFLKGKASTIVRPSFLQRRIESARTFLLGAFLGSSSRHITMTVSKPTGDRSTWAIDPSVTHVSRVVPRCTLSPVLTCHSKQGRGLDPFPPRAFEAERGIT